MRQKFVVIGSCIIDITVVTEKIPKVGESIVASQIFTQVGGKASNQAVAISRLGGRPYLLSGVGKDLWASFALQVWTEEGVDTSCVVQDDSMHTGMGIVTVDGEGQNVTLSTIGASKSIKNSDVKKILERAEEAKILSIHLNASHDVIYSALREAKRREMTTVLNGSPPEEIPMEFYKLTDVFIVNSLEASFYTGMDVIDYDRGRLAGMQFLDRGAGQAIITLGANGLVLVGQSSQHYIPAYKVKAVDTTGAGDIFTAGLVVALAEQQDFVSAARFACAVSALSVSKFGTLASIPFRKEVNQFIGKKA